MGLIVATTRIAYLNAYRLDLEYKIQLITQAKMGLSSSITDLLNAGSDLSPDNPVVKQLEQRREKLYLLDKKLDLQLAQYNAKLKMVDAELESARGMFEKNVKSSFSY